MVLICNICQQPVDPDRAVPYRGEKVCPDCKAQTSPAPDGGWVE